MNMIRLYTGKDGQTHIEELDLVTHPELTTMQATKGIVFRTTSPATSPTGTTRRGASSSSRWPVKSRSAWVTAACIATVPAT